MAIADTDQVLAATVEGYRKMTARVVVTAIVVIHQVRQLLMVLPGELR